jgi:hypothetical protein
LRLLLLLHCEVGSCKLLLLLLDLPPTSRWHWWGGLPGRYNRRSFRYNWRLDGSLRLNGILCLDGSLHAHWALHALQRNASQVWFTIKCC